jgi:hypothetical protein
MEVVARDHGNDCLLAFCNKLVVNFYRGKDRIDIGILGIGKGQRICCFQARLPSDDRAFDLSLPPYVVVPVNTQDECPSFCHWYNKIAVNLLNNNPECKNHPVVFADNTCRSGQDDKKGCKKKSDEF